MSEVEVLIDGHTTLITINRPEQMNALDRATFKQLEDAVAQFSADPDQYVAIFTGAGSRAFSAGADLKEMARQIDEVKRLPISSAPDIAGVRGCEKPTIAAINGLAVAGGLELALCCDIRIAVDDAWFGLFEPSRGIVAGIAVSLLPRMMSQGAAMDLLLTGQRMSAEEALRAGLVQEVVPAADLLAAAGRRAASIAKQSQPAVWATKKIARHWYESGLAEQQAFYEAVMHRLLLTGDMLEGPKAFAEQRQPRFSRSWPDPLGGPGSGR